MTYRKNVTYRCNVRRYVSRSKIHPVRPARPVLPVEKFIKSYNGELWSALDYERFINWLRAARRVRMRWVNKVFFVA